MSKPTIIDHLNKVLFEAYSIAVDEFEDKVSFIKEKEITETYEDIDSILEEEFTYILPTDINKALEDTKKYEPDGVLHSVLTIYKFFS